MSLEVGEHIPAAGAATYLDNVARHARVGAVLSWALPAQGGHFHVNEMPAVWVITEMATRGFRRDDEGTTEMRRQATKDWLRTTTHVFIRIAGAAGVAGIEMVST